MRQAVWGRVLIPALITAASEVSADKGQRLGDAGCSGPGRQGLALCANPASAALGQKAVEESWVWDTEF